MPTRKNNNPEPVEPDHDAVDTDGDRGGFYADGPSDGPNRRSPDDEDQPEAQPEQ
jgi:hypothetical protein